MRMHCPLHGETHEVYQGYRECSFVYTKVNYLADREDEEPIHIISTGKFKEVIDGQLLGLEQQRD